MHITKFTIDQSPAKEISLELCYNLAIGSMASAGGIPGYGAGKKKWAEVIAQPSMQALGDKPDAEVVHQAEGFGRALPKAV